MKCHNFSQELKPDNSPNDKVKNRKKSRKFLHSYSNAKNIYKTMEFVRNELFEKEMNLITFYFSVSKGRSLWVTAIES